MENESKQGLNNLTKKLVTESWLEKFVNTGSGWLIIISGSMAPLIQIKDQILIKKTTPSHIHIGDIITFWQGNILVTHRVIRKFTKNGNTYFIEKGDRTDGRDHRRLDRIQIGRFPSAARMAYSVDD